MSHDPEGLSRGGYCGCTDGYTCPTHRGERAPMPDDSAGPVQFPPFDPQRADAAFAEYARNDALSCKECRGSGMAKVMRYTSACLACKGTGRIPSATLGQTHYEGCERVRGHQACALAKLDAARADSQRLDWLNGRLNWFTTQGGAFDPAHKNIREAIDRALAARAQP